MVVIDTVVVPITIPVVTTIQAPTRTRKTGIDIPIRSIRILIAEVVTNVDTVADIDIRIVAKAHIIATKVRSIETIVVYTWQVDIRSVATDYWPVDVARQGRWSINSCARSVATEGWPVDVARQRRWSINAGGRSVATEGWPLDVARQGRWSINAGARSLATEGWPVDVARQGSWSINAGAGSVATEGWSLNVARQGSWSINSRAGSSSYSW